MKRMLVIVALALGSICACSRPADEDAIRGAIEAMATAAQSRSSGAVMVHVAADFTGNDGELDRAGLERLLKARLLAGNSIGVSIGALDVELSGDRATARFDAIVTDSSGHWIADHRVVLAMVTGWRRDGRRWVCYNARYTGGDR